MSEANKEKEAMEAAVTDELQFISFKLGAEEFGVEINRVKEILKLVEITPVPKSPAYFLGIMNLRGSIIPVLDLKIRVGIAASETTDKTKILVIRAGDDNYGIVVDEVSEVQRVARERIEPPPQMTRGIDKFYLEGVVKLVEEDRLIMMLNLSEVLNVEISRERSETFESSRGFSEDKDFVQEVIEEELLVTFNLGAEEFGLGIEAVKEILKVREVTVVPNVPDFVMGIQNVRGTVLPIINMKNIVGQGEIEADDSNTRILIVEVMGIKMGLMVERVNEVKRIPKKTIDTTPAIIASYGREISGVAKLQDGKQLILLLDETMIIDQDDVEAIARIQDDEVGERQAADTAVIDESQYVIFSVLGEEFGVNIDKVKEIFKVEEITPVPRSPEFIRGVTNLRGSIIPVVDIRHRFGVTDVASESRDIADKAGKIAREEIDTLNKIIEAEGNESITEFDSKLSLYLANYRTSNDIIVTLVAEIREAYEPLLVEIRNAWEKKSNTEEFVQLVKAVIDNKYPEFLSSLSKILLNSERNSDSLEKILVVTIKEMTVGLLVDNVHEVLMVQDSVIEDVPNIVFSNIDVGYLEGIAKLDSGERIVLILNIDDIMDQEDFDKLRNMRITKKGGELKSDENAKTSEADVVKEIDSEPEKDKVKKENTKKAPAKKKAARKKLKIEE